MLIFVSSTWSGPRVRLPGGQRAGLRLHPGAQRGQRADRLPHPDHHEAGQGRPADRGAGHRQDRHDPGQSEAVLWSRPPKPRPSQYRDHSVSRPRQDEDFEGSRLRPRPRPRQGETEARPRPDQCPTLHDTLMIKCGTCKP